MLKISTIKNTIIHIRKCIKVLIIVAISTFLIIGIASVCYKPIYSVTLNGEMIGYSQNKSDLQQKINTYIEKGNGGNVAFVDIKELPQYKLCLLKKGITPNDEEIFQKVISMGKQYYKYYGITVDNEEQNYATMKKSVMDEVKQIFKPEFLNRIDDIIVFHTLNQENMKQIVSLMSKTVIERAKENMQIDLSFTEEAISLIATEGYDQAYGARPLRRAIQSKIENFFAEQYLEGNFQKGDVVQIDVENENFILQKVVKND